MLYTDLHIHTKYSHGLDTPGAMYAAACEHGLRLVGFSEHSPRPEGFTYTHEYRDALKQYLPTYVQEVCALRDNPRVGRGGDVCSVLFGMEMDWLVGEEAFARRSAAAYAFDYLIGSVHFLGHWGFDDGIGPWADASQEECEHWYEEYFTLWEGMIRSGLYNIAAHPDLIKIYSKDAFAVWMAKPTSQERVRAALRLLKQQGMAMEISSAGLRKKCQEIYPCPAIVQLAYEEDVPITFASDAHAARDVAFAFDDLASYARSFGFREYVAFQRGKCIRFSL